MTAATHACVVLGIGLRAQAPADALQALWREAQAALTAPAPQGPQGHWAAHTSHAPHAAQVDGFCAVALLDSKARHPALARWLQAVAPHAAVIAVAQDQLPAQPVATHSPRLQARYGTGSVAEAAALSAAGPEATLIVPRLVAADGSATLAVAIRRAVPPDCCLAAAASVRAAPPLQGATA